MKLLPVRLLVVLSFLVFAVFTAGVSADTVVRSFKSKDTVETGQVVALVVGEKDTVELAPAYDTTRIFGVVIEPEAAPVTLQSQDQAKVYVATDGVYPVLVSTENGQVKAGDYLSLSSSDGIAAKVSFRQPFVLGRASQNYDGTSDKVGTGKDGAAIGRISVQVAPGKNPSLREDIAVPTLLRKLGESIAGKPLSSSRIYSALSIFIITVTLAFVLLWVGVRHGMIAIGRNPLSKHSIMQNLAQVIVASVIVLVGGLFGIYLLLRI